jgi:hypothetical protein
MAAAGQIRPAVVTRYRSPRRHVADESPDGSFQGYLTVCWNAVRARGWIGTRSTSPGHGKGETVAPHDTAKPAPDEARLSALEGRLLATMSLHAITAVYGEGGLRARLLLESGRLPGAQRDRIGAALALMSRLHERDRRQPEPYSCHPLRVTIRILSHYRVTDPDVACAALLHDTVARGAMTAFSAPGRPGTGTCSADQPPDDTTNGPTPSPWPWAAWAPGQCLAAGRRVCRGGAHWQDGRFRRPTRCHPPLT